MTSITSGGESYLCSCGHTLRSRDDVQEHLKRWRQLKHDNRCPEPSCDEGHGRNVRRHWTAKHLPDALRPKLVCKKCSQSYVKRKDLMNHMSRKQCSFNCARVLPGHEDGAPSRSALVNNILPTSGKDAFTGSAPTSSAFRQNNYHETERNTEISAVESRNNSNGSKPHDIAESQGHEQASRQHDYRWTPFTTNVTITEGAPVPNQNRTVANPLHDQQTFPQPFDNMYGLDLPCLDQVDLDLFLMPNAAMSLGDIYPGSDAFRGSQKLMSLTHSGTRDRLSPTLPLAAARTLSSGLTEAVPRQSSARRRRPPLELLVDFGASRTAGSREQVVNEASVEDACSDLTRTCSRSSVHHPGDKSARIRNLISSRSRPQPPAAAKRFSPRPPSMTASSWFEICLAASQKPKITPLKAISHGRLRAEPKKTRKDRIATLAGAEVGQTPDSMTPAQWKEICLAASCKPKVALPNRRKKPLGLRVRSNGDLHNDQALECINADAVRRVLPASTADSHGSQPTEPELPDEPNHERDICVFLPSADDLDKHLLSLKIA